MASSLGSVSMKTSYFPLAIAGMLVGLVFPLLAGCNNEKSAAETAPPPAVSNGAVMPKAGAPNGPTAEAMQRDKENAARAAQASKQAEAGLKQYLESQGKK